MYFALKARLSGEASSIYEISNWAGPASSLDHNLKYWTASLPGPEFRPPLDGRSRWSNTRNIHEYLAKIESGESPNAERIELDDNDRQSENLFLRLRLKDGVDLDEHLRRFRRECAGTLS